MMICDHYLISTFPVFVVCIGINSLTPPPTHTHKNARAHTHKTGGEMALRFQFFYHNTDVNCVLERGGIQKGTNEVHKKRKLQSLTYPTSIQN